MAEESQMGQSKAQGQPGGYPTSRAEQRSPGQGKEKKVEGTQQEKRGAEEGEEVGGVGGTLPTACPRGTPSRGSGLPSPHLPHYRPPSDPDGDSHSTNGPRVKIPPSVGHPAHRAEGKVLNYWAFKPLKQSIPISTRMIHPYNDQTEAMLRTRRGL